MINEQDYTMTVDPTTKVITLTPKKKEGERSRNKRGERYYYINRIGKVGWTNEENDTSDNDNYAQGNYYSTEAQAQAVADLRRHVYKFPLVKAGDSYLWLSVKRGYIWINYECLTGEIPSYARSELPCNATEEDRVERTRLIKNCYDLLGYVTI